MNFQSSLPYLILGGAIVISGILVFYSQKKTSMTLSSQSSSSAENQKFKNISSEDLHQLTQDTNIQILDIRTVDEFNSGHLANAENLDFYDPKFEERIAGLDKSKKYLVYCRSGNRSGKALEIMKKYNFSEVYNLSGGIMSVSKDLLCTTNC